MEHQLKSISKAGIPEAIAKAELYRYLNEPEEAESICRDILAVDPEHSMPRTCRPSARLRAALAAIIDIRTQKSVPAQFLAVPGFHLLRKSRISSGAIERAASNSPRFWLNSSFPSLSSTAMAGTPRSSGTSYCFATSRFLSIWPISTCTTSNDRSIVGQISGL